MKISGCVIQKRQILEYGSSVFNANYKGKRIYITSDHGFGRPEFPHLTRYLIDVVDIKSGMYDVETYDDCHDIKDAIRIALKGACLISNTTKP